MVPNAIRDTGYILAVTRGHNAGACLLKDGKVVFAIEEERIKATEEQRKKYEDTLKNAGQIGEQPVQNNVTPTRPDPKAEAWAEKNEWLRALIKKGFFINQFNAISF